jgi:type II secretory pathway pseudopilin PulG
MQMQPQVQQLYDGEADVRLQQQKQALASYYQEHHHQQRPFRCGFDHINPTTESIWSYGSNNGFNANSENSTFPTTNNMDTKKSPQYPWLCSANTEKSEYQF